MSSEHTNAELELGPLVRTFKADFNHTVAFYVGSGVICLLGGGAIALGVAVSHEAASGAPGAKAGEGIGAIIFGVALLPIALFFACAAFWNSKNRLQIFEKGLKIGAPTSQTQCLYTDIKNVGVTAKSFSIKLSPKLPGGEVRIKRLLIQLHNGETLTARCLQSPKAARAEIMHRLNMPIAFCPDCGCTLMVLNQQFCASCGARLQNSG
jgi:hypothetical protein